MEWVMVEDDHGRDPAVRLPGTSIILFPLTMISKRIRHGNKVDVFDLFSVVASQVDETRLGASNRWSDCILPVMGGALTVTLARTRLSMRRLA